jgi:hypothetical protein
MAGRNESGYGLKGSKPRFADIWQAGALKISAVSSEYHARNCIALYAAAFRITTTAGFGVGVDLFTTLAKNHTCELNRSPRTLASGVVTLAPLDSSWTETQISRKVFRSDSTKSWETKWSMSLVFP